MKKLKKYLDRKNKKSLKHSIRLYVLNIHAAT